MNEKCLRICLFFISLSFLLEAGNSTSLKRHPIRYIYLTWQKDTSTTITINAHNFSPSKDIKIFYDTESRKNDPSQYRYKNSNEGQKTSCFPDGRYLHRLELSRLDPNQTYYFIIGNEKFGFSEEKKFSLIPNTEKTLHFVQGGDWEVSDEAIGITRQAALQNPMAALIGGDYPCWASNISDYKKWDAWLDMYCENMLSPEGKLIPMILAIGNHEVEQNFNSSLKKIPFFLELFPQDPQGKTYFSRRLGAHTVLFVLDSGHAANHEGEQTKWLENEMEQSKEIPIKLAMYHIPIYPSVRFSSKDLAYHAFYQLLSIRGDGDVAMRMFSPLSEKGKNFWLPVFDKYHLTAAFEHHDHALKRTFPLFKDSIHPKGSVYLGDGGWGCQLQYPAIQAYFRPYFAKTMSKVHFFWDVFIFDNKSIQYRALSKRGEVYDEYIQDIVD